MEYLYIAESKSFPGVFKIGRTSRNVNHRMHELSEDDYGPTGFTGDSEWEAVRVIEVEDSIAAEALVHSHFAEYRIEGNRELFALDNPDQVASEISEITDGIIITADTVDLLDIATFNPVTLAMMASGLMVTAQTFFPENENTYKAEEFMRKWEKRLEDRAKNSEHPVAKGFFSLLNKSHKATKYIGTFAGILGMMPFWGKYEKFLDKRSMTTRHLMLTNNMGNKKNMYKHVSGSMLSDDFEEKLEIAKMRFKPMNPNTNWSPFPGWVVHCKVCNFINEKDDTFLKFKLLLENKKHGMKLSKYFFDEDANFKYFDHAATWIKEVPEFIYDDAVCDKCYLFGDKVKEHNVDIYLMGIKIFDISVDKNSESIKFCLSEEEIDMHANILNKKMPDYE